MHENLTSLRSRKIKKIVYPSKSMQIIIQTWNWLTFAEFLLNSYEKTLTSTSDAKQKFSPSQQIHSSVIRMKVTQPWRLVIRYTNTMTNIHRIIVEFIRKALSSTCDAKQKISPSLEIHSWVTTTNIHRILVEFVGGSAVIYLIWEGVYFSWDSLMRDDN